MLETDKNYKLSDNNDVFGTQELCEREIAARENGKRERVSLVWSMQDLLKRE
jgi:hypothetical protein